MASTKTNTRDDTKTLTTSWRNRHLKNIYFVFFTHFDNVLTRVKTSNGLTYICFCTARSDNLRKVLVTHELFGITNLKLREAHGWLLQCWSKVLQCFGMNETALTSLTTLYWLDMEWAFESNQYKLGYL